MHKLAQVKATSQVLIHQRDHHYHHRKAEYRKVQEAQASIGR
jgi:hypothetical protein